MNTCVSDSELADHVRSALHKNSYLFNKDISIFVQHGWVSLEGKVAKEEDRRIAQLCVENILGVYGVTNNLTYSRIHSYQTS